MTTGTKAISPSLLQAKHLQWLQVKHVKQVATEQGRTAMRKLKCWSTRDTIAARNDYDKTDPTSLDV